MKPPVISGSRNSIRARLSKGDVVGAVLEAGDVVIANAKERAKAMDCHLAGIHVLSAHQVVIDCVKMAHAAEHGLERPI